ncbi:MAG TPA: c-type cytochrome domain-containing protein [Chthonomonadaceae bacterium]|nr:c-type cytochrome domain-containing protein [Chthonomonadaceae bacterium]
MRRIGALRAAGAAVVLAAVSISVPASEGALAQARPGSAAQPSFYRDVNPIFRTACTGCHNMEAAASGLNLTSYATAIKGGRGGALLVPGKAADSRLYKYLTGVLKPQMPPGAGLKQTDIDKVKQWIDAGAKEDQPTADTRRATSRTPAKSVRTASVAAHAPFALTRPAPVTALAFSADGKTLAVGTYREVQFWSLDSGAMVGRWTGHADTVRGLAYSRDGKLLAAAGGASGAAGEVRLWDAATAKELRAFGDDTDAVNAVAFSPDGTKLATASSDKLVKTWETATGKLIATGRDHSDAVWGIDWSPDGKYIASGGADRSVKLWDAASMKRLYSLGGHEDVVFAVEFGADSKSLVSASADHTARIWNIGPESGSPAHTLAGHSANVTSASSSSGGLIATASGDKTVRLWDNVGSQLRTLTGPKDWLYSVRISRDGKLVAGGAWDGTVTIWTAADGKQTFQLSTAQQR